MTPAPPATPESIRDAKRACQAERERIAALTGIALPRVPMDEKDGER